MAAFRAMPNCPVYGVGSRLRAAATGRRTAMTDVLEWAALLAGDPDGRTYLRAWARCRATRETFAALVRGRGWAPATAERGRRRAADTIARGLNGGMLPS